MMRVPIRMMSNIPKRQPRTGYTGNNIFPVEPKNVRQQGAIHQNDRSFNHGPGRGCRRSRDPQPRESGQIATPGSISRGHCERH